MVAVSYQVGAIARIDTTEKFLVLITAARGLGARALVFWSKPYCKTG